MTTKIVVTGGTGYIGSHTVVELLNAGYEVVIIDNLSNSHEWIIENIHKITGKNPLFLNFDLCDREKTLDFFHSQKNIAGVIHFAAFKMVEESVMFPGKYYFNNLNSLMNVLEGMRLNHIDNLIFSSSCTVYGQPEIIPINEKAPLADAWSPYGTTKLFSEKIIKDTTASTDFNAVSLRYFNPVGAHLSGILGELPIGKPQNLMPVITQTAIGKQTEFFIHGFDYPTCDGTCIRDYFHVSDLAKAHIKAFEFLFESRNIEKYSVFNLGSEKGYSVMEVVKAFEKINNIKLNYKIGPRRQGDVEQVYADSSLAYKVLGWKAELTLEQMVESAWKWEKYLASR